MSPRRAVEYIQSFQLRVEEATVLIEGDVHGLSCVQVADKLHTTPETVKRRRRAAYAKIQDAIEYEKGWGG